MSRIGFITGLRSEARLIAAATRRLEPDSSPLMYAAGGSAVAAYGAGRAMARQGIGALVSFGIAGGIDPTMSSGELVVADAVVDSQQQRYETAASWRDRLYEEIRDVGSVKIGTIAGQDQVASTVADKAALYADGAPLAVDMESHGVGRAAAESEIPFLILRAIADPADRTIPAVALAGMGPSGETLVLPVLIGLMREPRSLPGLLNVARDTRAAMTALRRAASRGLTVLTSP